ncbi:beta-phosphoglucomutase [Aliterella atlantica]|uniref:HAD family hydrolase n=1 Tax=Aliterella atlantica CENA595 TaxID=1618023 RepID=A0A0D8ZNX8_9CYAN|nr:beta-phosphoglucomutase [Aliterella atlantica]KJH70523.1 HAD family hydrolase [Aliterella atlantica CENA595]
MNQIGWNVIETEFVPAELHHKETMFALGNGYLSTRGTFEEGYPGENATTFIHGVYDDVPVVYTELVNCPNWLPLKIAVDGEVFSLDRGEVLEYKRQLDLRWGILSRDVVWRSPKGQTLHLRFDRLTSMAEEHVLIVRCQITPIDFAGEIEVIASIDTNVDNQGVKHWEHLNAGDTDNSAWLQLGCLKSKIELGMATQLTCSENAIATSANVNGNPTLSAKYSAQTGRTVTVEKIVTVFTSRQVSHPAQVAQERLVSLPSYTTLLAAHGAVWDALWRDCDVVIEGDSTAQLAIRYNLFQLLIAAPRHEDRVSIPAKTLTGYAYRGHVFWDTEIFIVPFLTLTQPQIARNLLSYRYYNLDGARRKAHEAGYEGAMYPWESASTGDEVTPRWVTGADGHPVRIWCGDIELHITTDVAYGVWQYWQATGDDEWMQQQGAEIILDTAVFWGSRAEWNSDRQCYEIRDVIGPDENHEHVDNNTFTNRMVQWHMETAIAVLDWLRQHHPAKATALTAQLDLTGDRLQRWSHIAQHLLILHNPETGIIEQYEGFFNLIDVDLSEYEGRTKSMQAILGIEETNQRQILKQPDVLMLLYMLRQSPLKTPWANREDLQLLRANWDYYTPRTDHTYGSSLGPAIHAILACDLDQSDEAYEHFMRAALVDLKDVRGNAHEGIHAASTGGSWQAVVFGFGGVRLTETGPIVDTPHLPPGWTRLNFKLHWQKQCYEFDISSTNGVTEVRVINNSEVPTLYTEKLPETFMDLSIKPTATEMPIKGVIFDLDGVITDTSEHHYRAWQQLADEEGIAFNRQANESMRGLARRDSLLHLLGDRQVTEAQIQEMMMRKNGYYEQFIQTLTADDLLPGVLPLLDELQATGIKIAIGSSSKNAQLVTKLLGISERLDAISDGYSVERHKPAPDVFLHAAMQLGLDPADCLVVEDAAAGVEAGLNAGMWVVGLGPTERFTAAHVICDDLAEVSWHDLTALLADSQIVCLPIAV